MICATRSGSQSASATRPRRRSSRCDSWAASAGANSPATARAISRGRCARGAARASRPPAGRGRGGRWRACARRSTCSRSWLVNTHARLLVELLVLEQLEEAAEREDRRAQLVRGRGDEAAPRRVELGELALHVVERPREAPSSSLSPPTKRAPRSPRPRPGGRPPPSAVIAAAQRAATRHAGERRSEEGDGAGDEDPPRMSPTVSSTSLERRGEDHDRAAIRRRGAAEQRLGRLGHAALRSPASVPGVVRPERARSVATREAQVADLGRLGRVGLDVGLHRGRRRGLTPRSVTRSPEASAACRTARSSGGRRRS